jgi:N6-adenosine-specific RNA methylase IME4
MSGYRSVVIDPPWPQGKTGHRSARPNQGVALDYPTMTIPQIAALPVRKLLDRDALVFLWATDRHLETAYQVLRGWGLRRHATLVWYKNTGVCPFSVQFRAEFCLMGVQGTMRLARVGLPTVIVGKSGRHSAKPEESYRWFEAIGYPPRLELFARRARPGWDVWGDEAPNSIALEFEREYASGTGPSSGDDPRAGRGASGESA